MVSRECVLATKTIKMYGVDRQYQNLKHEVLDITDRVLSTGQILDGDYTTRFELVMAHRLGREYAIAVNSATTGLVFALKCLFSGEKSGLLIPAVSYIATMNSAILSKYANIQICDVDPSGLMDLGRADQAMGSEIQTVMYVNLFGNTVDWDRFKIMTQFFGSEQVRVIEDAAQSFGASFNGVPSGKMGDISVLSFDPTKNLNNFGSGGMILTDDITVYELVKNLRDNGKHTGHEMPGINSKMSEVDCAIMTMKLKHFDKWQARRTEIADYYTRELQGLVEVPVATPGTTHAWSKYVIRVPNRMQLKKHLDYNDIESKPTYTRALYEEFVGRSYAPVGPTGDDNWECHRFTRECLSLPIYPELYDSEVERVVRTIREYFR
jgi:dTDP-4-amino-4,6-dideoxygalactose transaminase